MPVIDDRQIVTLRTYTGKQLYQFPPSKQLDLSWSWEQRRTTNCTLTVPSLVADPRIPPLSDIVPWLHWIDVFNSNGQQRYWSGPIMWLDADDATMTITASDPSALLGKTRCPLTKRWDAADPARIADQLWRAMAEQQGLPSTTHVRDDPRDGVYDFNTTAELAGTEPLSDTFGRLTDLGLYWTVAAGVPYFGPAPLTAITTLGRQHFLGSSLRVRRDGTQAANDVVVRGADAYARARAEMGGLNLQAIDTLDSVTGVSNVRRAVNERVAYTAAVRTVVTTPDGGAVLAPNAPVRAEQLVPSTRLVVDAYGVQSTVEVSRVTFSASQGQSQLSVKLESVNDDLPELLTLQESAAPR